MSDAKGSTSSEVRLRAACAELDRRWRDGESVGAEHFLAKVGEEADEEEFALELIYTELLARERRREQLAPDLWLARFPRWRAPLARLLEVHALARDSQDDAAAVATVPASGDEAGMLVAGKYQLVHPIGAGGMGSVWLADQLEPVHRRVALKLIRPDRDGSQMILSRFEAERQAIAMMDHPHIARLLDAGTTDGTAGGRPYFVMELVQGHPLTEYCDRHKLSIPDRLRLFLPICAAVQHAHQRGIIHRDLKPTNILVEVHDEGPVPKVIDFGLAKALSGQPLVADTLLTGIGTVAGTPLYMAPEQARLSTADVDTRTDVYALGVILYELLTGSTPIERALIHRVELDEILRVIRDSEPPAPSRRLSSAETLPEVAANRQTEPVKLGRLVRGELDWIVMKALAKEKDHRYDSASDLAKDIERFLNQEPVLAGPPSTGYRLRKFVTRNKVQVLAGTLVLLALLLGIAGTTYGLLRAEQRRRQAERARDRTRGALDAMTSSITGHSLSTQKELSEDQRKFLAEVLTYYQEFAGERADDEHTRSRTAAAAYRVGTIESRLGRKQQALTAFLSARDRYQQLVTEFDNVAEYRQGLATSSANLGVLLGDLGKRPEAEHEHGRALDLLEALVAETPASPVFRYDLAKTHGWLGVLLSGSGRGKESEEQHRVALDILEKLSLEFPDDPEYLHGRSVNHNNLGLLLQKSGMHERAQREYQNAIVVQEKLVVDFPAQEYRDSLARSYLNLGVVLNEFGKRSESEEAYHRALVILGKLVEDFPGVPGHRRTLAWTHNNRGKVLHELGDRAAAEEQHRLAVTLRERLAAEFPNVPTYRAELAVSYVNYAGSLNAQGKRAPVEDLLRKALATQTQLVTDAPSVPEYKQDLINSHNNMAALLINDGKVAEAASHCRQALAVGLQLVKEFPAVPKYRLSLARTRSHLAGLLGNSGEIADAVEQYSEGLAIREQLVADFPSTPEYRRDLAASYYNLGNVLNEHGKHAEGEEHHRRGLAIRQKLVADFPGMPEYRQELAASHINLGGLLHSFDRPEAKDQYTQALAIQRQLVEDFPAVVDYRVQLGVTYSNLGHFVRGSGQPRESLEWYNQAVDLLQPVHARDGPPLDTQFLLNSYWGRAVAYDALQRHAEALADWEQVVALSPPARLPGYRASRAMSRLHNDRLAEALPELAELAQLTTWKADEWYGLACVFAVASTKVAERKEEFATQAMEFMRKAVAAGFKDTAHVAQNPSLDSLRARDDFAELLGKITADKN